MLNNTEEEIIHSNRDKRKTYGNMVVLYDNNCLITVGPDCTHFIILDPYFLSTFICLLIFGLAMTLFIKNSSDSIILWIVNAIISLFTCVSYVAVALSDPGIIT